ncbi:IS30 family transposase, partial [Enterococcus raffinosus]
RSKSTISREIIRNQEFEDFKYYPPKRRQHVYKYNALIAQHNAITRSRKIGTKSKFTKEMAEAISENHLRHWSPEQMVHGDKRVTVSRNTIYNWILRDWIDKVPHSRIRKYRKRSNRKHAALSQQKREMIQTRTIENRPKEVNERKCFGDWEIDCILPSREGKKCIVTINERKSRFTFMALAKTQSASGIIPVIDTFMALHGDAVRSITCDRGKEFANSSFINCIEDTYQAKVYFAHAYTPQERGTNENTNGLIRAFLPKKKTFESKTQADMIFIANELNTRPKKIHGFTTCKEVYERECAALNNSS